MPPPPEPEINRIWTYIQLTCVLLWILSGTATVGVAIAAIWHTPRVLVLLLLMLALHWPLRLVSKPVEDPDLFYPDAEKYENDYKRQWMF